MRHIILHQHGPAEVLRQETAPLPTPGPGEITLKITAAGVNFSDILRRRNTYFLPTPVPFVPGTEAVGRVETTGPEVSTEKFSAGSRVLAILPSGGGYAEYAVASAEYCIPLPPQIDDRAATALFVQGSTAYLLVNRVAGNLQGKSVLVHAAAGGVGSLIVQMAKSQGATVIAAAGAPDKLSFARSLGADRAVNYRQNDWTKEVLDATGNKGVDYIYEMVGGRVYEQSIDALTPGGTLVVYGAASGEPGRIPSERFVDKNQHLRSFNLAHYIGHHPELWQEAIGRAVELAASGELRLMTPNAYALSKAVEAHKDMESRKTTGKVVLLP